MFYKFINENRIQPCPNTGIISGRAISNLPRYFEINPSIAKAENYKKLVVDVEPSYNIDTQYLEAKYENTEDVIIKHWAIKNVEQDVQDDDVDEIAQLKEQLDALKLILGVE